MGLFEKTKRKYGCSDLPRILVHDKASYMVPPMHNRLQRDFAEALRQSGFRSGIGTKADSAKWPVRKFGTYAIRPARADSTTKDYCISTRRRTHKRSPPLRTTSSHCSRSDLANPNKPLPPSVANAAEFIKCPTFCTHCLQCVGISCSCA